LNGGKKHSRMITIKANIKSLINNLQISTTKSPASAQFPECCWFPQPHTLMGKRNNAFISAR
jgi:hypothetical protein